MTNAAHTIEEANERIEDIFDLNYLKKYACLKYQHKREWYLECIDCKSKNKCRAGKQANFLMNNSTAPEQKEPNPPEDKTRAMIEDIFRSKDPVRTMLERSGNIKPQSVYQKVWAWKKKYPDLEEKYQMLGKFNFLWRNPWDSMKVPDIIKELYSANASTGEHSERDKLYSSSTEDAGKLSAQNAFKTISEKPVRKFTDIVKEHYGDKVKAKPDPKEVSYTDIAPNSKIFTVEPDITDSSEDSISLEDFLRETSDSEAGEAEVKAGKEAEAVSDQRTIQEAASSSKDPAYSSMAELKEKLEKDICDYEAKIQEIRKQIEAIDTVQALMAK